VGALVFKTEASRVASPVPDGLCATPCLGACLPLVHDLLPTPASGPLRFRARRPGGLSNWQRGLPARDTSRRFGLASRPLLVRPPCFAAAVPAVPPIPGVLPPFPEGGGPPKAGRPLARASGPDWQRRPARSSETWRSHAVLQARADALHVVLQRGIGVVHREQPGGHEPMQPDQGATRRGNQAMDARALPPQCPHLVARGRPTKPSPRHARARRLAMVTRESGKSVR
jgi:hypothetical protein